MYNKLEILNKTDCQDEENVLVRAVATDFKKVPTVKTDTVCVIDSIKDLKDNEKIEELVKYFLRNNTIKEMTQFDDKIRIKSTCGRTLDLSLTSEYSYLLDVIRMKYETDRLQFLDKYSDIKEIIIQDIYFENFKIVTNTTGYFVGYATDSEEACIVLSLMRNKGNVLNFEQEFLKKYLTELTAGHEIINFSKFYGRECKIYCNGTMVHLPFHFIDEVLTAVMNHNYMLKEEDNKQLKLEGII